ncbi:MAG TPA: carboxyl transferase domain-containing protein [Acidimicrobiales bacterium]|nr:carboxyl transferase domain-containing protein [Acidimicrobiales bacterium]
MTTDGRLSAEEEFVARFDGDRTLLPGTLTPRQRIESLADPGTWLELGRLARSQQRAVVDETPADGLITGWCRVEGRLAVVLVEDPLAAARTDGQVARNKWERLLTTARRRGAAVIALIDGHTGATAEFGPLDGELFGHLADGAPAAELAHPAIAVVFGAVEGPAVPLVAEADVVIAVAGSGCDADARAADDGEALAMARAVLGASSSPAAPTSTPPATAAGSSEVPLSAIPVTAEGVLELVADPATTVFLGRARAVRTGLCRIKGFPVAVAVAVSGQPVGTADLAVVHRLVRAAEHLQVAILMVQDIPGYDRGARTTRAFGEELSGIVSTMRRVRAPKLVLVAGRGHVIGTFALGGRGLGVDYIVTWPWAGVALQEGVAPREGPYEAAGMGLVDDVITPAETPERIATILEMMAPVHVLTTPEEDRKGRVVAEISKV